MELPAEEFVDAVNSLMQCSDSFIILPHAGGVDRTTSEVVGAYQEVNHLQRAGRLVQRLDQLSDLLGLRTGDLPGD